MNAIIDAKHVIPLTAFQSADDPALAVAKESRATHRDWRDKNRFYKKDNYKTLVADYDNNTGELGDWKYWRNIRPPESAMRI